MVATNSPKFRRGSNNPNLIIVIWARQPCASRLLSLSRCDSTRITPIENLSTICTIRMSGGVDYVDAWIHVSRRIMEHDYVGVIT